MADKPVKVKVKFTEIQMDCLESLRKEGKLGSDYGQIASTIFHEYLKGNFSRGEK